MSRKKVKIDRLVYLKRFYKSVIGKLHIFQALLFSLLSSFALSEYMNAVNNIGSSSSLFEIVFFLAVFHFTLHRPLHPAGEAIRLDKITLAASIFTAFAIIIGSSLYQTHTISALFDSFWRTTLSVLHIIGLSHVFYLLFERVFCLYAQFRLKYSTVNSKNILYGSDWRTFLLLWGAIFICWLPVWLAYYPGILAYDAIHPFRMWYGAIPFDDSHTILWTLFYHLAFTIGGTAQNGVIAYALLQMAIMSAIFSFALCYFARLKMPIWVRIVSFIYFSFSPFIVLYSFATTKDVIFGGLLVLVVVYMTDMAINNKAFFNNPNKQLFLGLSLALFGLFRHNGFHVVAIVTIFVMVIYRKYWIKTARIFVGATLIIWLIMSPFTSALNIGGAFYHTPTWSVFGVVQNQQIARVAINHWENLNQYEQEPIERFFFSIDSVKETFHPRHSDWLRRNYGELAEGVQDYRSLWRNLVRQYPISAIDAFLDLNLPSWFPDANINEFIYIQDEIRPWFGDMVWRDSVFPNAFQFYHQFSNNNSILQKLPVLSWMFSLGATFWMIFFTFILCIVSKNYKMITPLLPAIILWSGNLLGPLTNGRYAFPIIALYPLFLVIVILTKRESSKT